MRNVLCLCSALLVLMACGTVTTAAADEQAPAEDGWTTDNLFYGPIEMATSVLAPFVGTFGGLALGIAVPLEGMAPGSEVLIPYTAAGGMALGTATGALLTPVLMAEGVWDTLTFGAFADRPFSWFNTNVQFKANVDVSKMEAGTATE